MITLLIQKQKRIELIMNDTENKKQFLFDSILTKHTGFIEFLNLASKIEDESFFIAGGAVRDAIQNKYNFKDIDLFINEKYFHLLISSIGSKGRLVKNQFDSYRWFPDNLNSFYYDIIIIEKFNNGLWRCENIIDVLNQFDITANAIAIDIKTKKLFNPQNGLLHIESKTLRAVRFDYPEIPLSDKIPIPRNSILWFRYIYYSKKLDFDMEKITKLWVEENNFRIKDLELFKKHFFEPF